MSEIFDNLRNEDDKLVNDFDRVIHKAKKMYSEADLTLAVEAARNEMQSEIERLRSEKDILKYSVENYVKIVSGIETELTSLRSAMVAKAKEWQIYKCGANCCDCGNCESCYGDGLWHCADELLTLALKES